MSIEKKKGRAGQKLNSKRLTKFLHNTGLICDADLGNQEEPLDSARRSSAYSFINRKHTPGLEGTCLFKCRLWSGEAAPLPCLIQGSEASR